MDKEFIRNLSAAVEAGGRLLGDLSGAKRQTIEVEDGELADDFVEGVQGLNKSIRELTAAVKELQKTIADRPPGKKK